MQTAEWISLQWLDLTLFLFLRKQGTGWALKRPVGGRSQSSRPVKEPLHDPGQEFHFFMLPQALSLRSIRKTEPHKGFQGLVWKLAGWALGTERAKGAMGNVGGQPL